jgi:hypothetical protein
MSSSSQPEQDPKTKALNSYRKRLLEHRELDAKLKECKPAFLLYILIIKLTDCS